MIINVEGINIEKKTNGYSAKIGDNRLCNIYEIKGLYKVKCRSKIYADKFPCDYVISNGAYKTRKYYFYYATLDKKQLEKWLTDVKEIGINKRLDNR